MKKHSSSPPFKETDRVWLVPTVVVYVKGGAVQWVASNEPSTMILVLDGDTQDPKVPASCWREVPVRLAEVESKLWRIAVQAVGALPLRPLPPAKSLTCSCGSTEWRIDEKEVIHFNSCENRTRSVAITDRGIWCVKCGDRPLDIDAVTEAYLAVNLRLPLVEAAISVVKCWDHGDLAGAVRDLVSSLEGLGYAIQ
jgi:hypothetical protein